MRERMSETFARSPEEALQRMFDDASKRLSWSYPDSDTAFIWQCSRGKNENTWYGSYKHVSKKMLEGRKYEIYLPDGIPGIKWLDVVHNPRTYKSEPIENENASISTK